MPGACIGIFPGVGQPWAMDAADMWCMTSVHGEEVLDPRQAEAALSRLLDRVERLVQMDEAGELLRLDALPAVAGLQQRLDGVAAERDRYRRQAQWLRDRIVQGVARSLAERGVRRIALYGAGYHTVGLVRQPWRSYGIEVVAILDDRAAVAELGGVRVVKPEGFAESVDAVVVSSDSSEEAIWRRAREVFAGRGIEVVRLYGAEDAGCDAGGARAMLVERFGVSEEDASWLIENRMERHDAMLPMLPARRTEMHLRRYEFAARHASGARVLDCACGTGYGSRLLADRGRASSVLGVDVDARTIEYARRRYGDGERVRFKVGDACALGVERRSVDLIASFETVEHVRDPEVLLDGYARALAPGGTLVISTPNDLGVQPHHYHSFTQESFRLLVMRHFLSFEQYGQVEEDEPRWNDAPAGIYPLGGGYPDPEVFIFIARMPKRG